MGEKENIIAKTYDFLLYLLPQLDKFPRKQKFIIADRIENLLLEILEKFISAYYLPADKKTELLGNSNTKLEILRHYIRLSYDMKFIDIHRYEVISEKINEIVKRKNKEFHDGLI